MKKMTLAGYQITDLIYEGTRTQVYRGVKTESSKPAILKKLRKEYPTFNDLLQFRHQYVLSKNLDVPGIVKPIALEKCGNGYVLVMADVGGVSLSEYVGDRPLGMEEFLQVAIALCKILEYLYRNRVIHKDIKPANILINPETKEIYLIDFSISSLLPRETQEIQNPNILEGTLAYISPEQTGRMNRGIDYRSDFYSLGVTFYQLLTGELPFSSDDPMELVHCHIAKTPIPPHQLKPEIPLALSEIAMKLMAKTAEKRYQSARGIKHDLEKCWQQWQETGSIAKFELGERDISDRFLTPEKLYGREQEVQTLLDAFERVAKGNSEMMLVAGFSGIGKTAVVNEVHKPIVRQRGYFIKGKFDQFNRNIPFSAFVIAFRDLMGQLLGSTDAQLQKWKEKILAAVGENGQVIIDVIPELEYIVGEQPSVPELSGTAAQNRFNLLFEKFIAVFTTQEHPLTLFLDDLQWADSASLNLLKVLMGDHQMGYLLLLGAYRDNEVFPAHPLMLCLGELEKQQTPISTITLTPLSVGDIDRLVAETLSCPVELASPLTDLVYQKTQGNPFFTTQFLKGLHEDGLIIFNQNLGYWECDLVKVRDAALTDDVVEFMAGRLHKLPSATQNVLKLAACIGNQFDLETLAIICENPSEEVAADLWSALREGLVLPLSETYKFFQGWEGEKEQAEGVAVGYRFLHDRVQQAAYSLIPEDQRKGTHFNIGTLLLEKIPEAQLEEEIFTITSHLNRGLELIPTPEKQLQLCELNLLATQKAKSSTAYTAAWEYVETGIQLLEKSSWQTYYDLTLNLYTEAVEIAYLKSDFETMEQMAEIVFSQAHHILDQVKVYEMQVQRLSVQNQFIPAIEVALSYLKLLGVDLPSDPTEEEVGTWIEKTNRAVDNMSDEAMVERPEMTNREMKAAMEIISRLIGPCYFFRPNLLAISACQSVLLSLEYGNTLDTPPALSMYATALCNVNDISRAYRSGKIGVKILQKQHKNPRKTLAFNMFYAHVFHWSQHFRHSIDPLYEAYQSGIDVGELEFASYALTSQVDCRYCAGEELSGLIPDFKRSVEFCYSNQLEGTGFYTASVLQTAYNLIHGSEKPWCLQGEFYDETTVVESFHKNRNITGLAIHHFNKIYLSYLFEGDLESLFESEKYLYGIQGHLLFPIFNFVGGLAYLSLAGKAISEERSQYLERAKKYSDLLKFWAGHAPMNFQHKSDLMQAETCRVLGQKLEAIELYDKAIDGAKANEYIQEEALANELAAKFYLDWGKEKIAAVYMTDAYYGYARWGAKAKVADLEARYPYLLAPILQQQQASLAPSSLATMTRGTLSKTTTGTVEILDLATLMKASRTLSENIELEGAIANLMQVAMENAGAETAALMLFEEEVLMLSALVCGEEAPQIDPIPVETSNVVPLSIVNQVKRTQEPIALDNASNETAFAGDAYIRSSQPQSILCLPLVDRGKLIGILYLENNRVAGAFTGDRVEVLTLLCSQAAISLENARLYQESRNYAQQLEQTQLQLVQSEKMATVGQLTAGVAHEINNPVGFISGNLDYASEYIENLAELLQLYQQGFAPDSETIQDKIEEIELDYLLEDFRELICSMKEGTNRIVEISKSLRTFSRADTAAKVAFNIHDGIDSTLLILKHRLKANQNRPEIEIIKKYGNLPEVNCYTGQLNQVFMNLIANAIDAFEEGNIGRSFDEIKADPNLIAITTEFHEAKQLVIVRIKDNGMGMNEEVKAKVFQHLFTTKRVGKGTGLGLSISRQIVEEKHGGKITLTSEPGKGAEFAIALPLT